MFIWDFLASLVLDQIIDWIYNTVVGFLGDFFALMGQMGAELFDLPWVEAVTLFFSNFAWALYITGIVVAGFECAIEAQNGRGDIKATCLNILKGFFAVNLFNIVPIRLYQFCISLQASFTSDLTSINVSNGVGTTAAEILQDLVASAFNANPTVMLFVVIMMGYAVIKVFFGNLKRGGIMVIQIAVGSLFMFSVPRGYIDGFIGWTKQVIGLCLTAFLQSTILIVGLLVLRDHKLLGLGLMLSATEIPRVSQQFGLETGTKANIMGAIYTTQSIVNFTKTIAAVSAQAMMYLLEHNPHIQEISLCLDNDVAGISATERLTEVLKAAGYENVSCRLPEFKDWNEQVKSLCLDEPEMALSM